MRSYPSTAYDWYNFLAQDVNSDALIQFVIPLEERLTFAALQKAYAHCLVEEPVLAATFCTNEPTPVWREGTHSTEEVCCERFASDEAAEIKAVLSERLDAQTTTPVRVSLIHGKTDDTLVVKVHHALCDGYSAMQFVRMLAKYFNPTAVATERTSLRDFQPFYDYFGIKEEDKASRLDFSSLPAMALSWGTPVGDLHAPQAFDYQTLSLSEREMKRLSDFAADNGVSINSVLTAAFHRALVEVLHVEAEEKEIQFTSNFRKYAPAGTVYSLSNLSNIFEISLPVTLDFTALVIATERAIRTAIEPERSLQSALASEAMSTDFASLREAYTQEWEEVQNSGLCTPMISNLGLLSKDALYFGSCAAKSITVVPPAFAGPAFMLGVSTYLHEMTLSAAYQTPSTPPSFVRSLLEAMKAHLTTLN